MVKRTLSTVALWTVIGIALWNFRTNGALVLLALITALTLREFYQLMHAMGHRPFDKLGIFFGTLITLAPWFEAQCHWPAHPLLALATVVFSVRLLGERTPETRVESLATTAVTSTA